MTITSFPTSAIIAINTETEEPQEEGVWWLDAGKLTYSYGIDSFVIPDLEGWKVSGAVFTRNGTSFDLTFDRTQYIPTTTRDYYVAPTGSDSNDGLAWGTAKLTIDNVVTTAASGGFVPRIYCEGGSTYANTGTMSPVLQIIGVDRGSGSQATLDTLNFVTNDTYATTCYVQNVDFATLIQASSSASLMCKDCNFTFITNDATSFYGDGIIILEDCTVDGADGDGFDYGDTVSGFEINCTVINCGTQKSDNGSTGHDSSLVVRYGGTYTNNWRNIHDVNQTKSYIIDCTINTSQTGGSVAYDSFNVGSGQQEAADENTKVTIWSGDISGGAVTDVFCDSDAVLNISNLVTFFSEEGSVTDFEINHSIPVNTTLPTIDNTSPIEGNVLTGSVGVWENQPNITFSYRWLVNRVAVSGETDKSYTVRTADNGKKIKFEVTATKLSGAIAALTAPTNNVQGSDTLTFNSAANEHATISGLSSTLLSGAFTIEAEVVADGTDQAIFSRDDLAGGAAWKRNGGIVFGTGGGWRKVTYVAGATYRFVYDPALSGELKYRIFVDGVEGTYTLEFSPGTITSDSGDLYIGRRIDGSYRLNGSLKDFKLWDDTKIPGGDDTTDLILHLQILDATTWYDSIGSNDATLVNY